MRSLTMLHDLAILTHALWIIDQPESWLSVLWFDQLLSSFRLCGFARLQSQASAPITLAVNRVTPKRKTCVDMHGPGTFPVVLIIAPNLRVWLPTHIFCVTAFKSLTQGLPHLVGIAASSMCHLQLCMFSRRHAG